MMIGRRQAFSPVGRGSMYFLVSRNLICRRRVLRFAERDHPVMSRLDQFLMHLPAGLDLCLCRLGDGADRKGCGDEKCRKFYSVHLNFPGYDQRLHDAWV